MYILKICNKEWKNKESILFGYDTISEGLLYFLTDLLLLVYRETECHKGNTGH